ncbi:MAG TPA: condensation domain-containing protein [Pyrinomonadaceae bacterium]|nr:condensation domain-containing protein [Pyrinomonadaceae bacterium]
MTKGTGGDIYPFVQLAKSLKARGHEVSLLTHRFFEGVVGRAGINFVAIDAAAGSERRVLFNPVLTDMRDLLAAMRESVATDLASEYDLIRRHAGSDRGVVLVAHENLHLTAQTAAEGLNLPTALVFLSPNGVQNVPLLAEQYDLLADDINRVRARLGLAPVADWRAWAGSAQRALGFWPEWFAPRDARWLLDVEPVGFVRNPDIEEGETPERLRRLLGEGEPPVMISHGTSVPQKDEFFDASVGACRLLGRRAVLVSPFGSRVEAGLPVGVEWFEYLPFASVMPRMAAVVHHGGIGTAAQALEAGLPQVVLAFGYDRPHNAARLQSLGVGAHLPPVKWQAAPVAEAIERLTGSAAVRERARELSRLLAVTNSCDAACESIEKLTGGAARRVVAPTPKAEGGEATTGGKAAQSGALRELVGQLSPEKRALLAARLKKKVGTQLKKQTIARREGAGPAPLSFSQQRMWILDRLVPGNPAHNLVSAVRLTGPFNAAAFEQALSEIVRRHEVLRTVFTESGGEPAQVVQPPRPLRLTPVDLSGLPPAERESRMRRLVGEASQRPFDLERGPLLRVVLVRLDAEEHVVSFTMHHIVGDGRSTEVLTREVTALYVAFLAGAASPLPELPIQYADYAVWQRGWLRGEALEEQLAYWRGQLKGASATFELNGGKSRPAKRTFGGASPWFLISRELTDSLKAFSQRQDSTLFMTLVAAFKSLIHFYSEKTDIVIGTPVANRNRAELAGMIGFFANSLVLRTELAGDPTFEELLGRVKAVASGAYAHQEVPFERLVEVLRPERSLNHTPLFQVAFTLHSSADVPAETAGLKVSQVFSEVETAPFDLVLTVDDAKRGLGGVFNYSTDLFDAAVIQQMSADYNEVLQAVVPRPEIRLSALRSVVEEARRKRAAGEDERLEASSRMKLKSARRKAVGAA